jgi:hypothetical protein
VRMAMALVLLVSALLMIRTFAALRNVEPGFTDAEHLQTIRISIPGSLVANPPKLTSHQHLSFFPTNLLYAFPIHWSRARPI